MLLFLLIPLGLLVLTIALAPLLALAVVPDRQASGDRDAPVRLPWGMGGTADVPVAVEVDRERYRAA